MQMISINYILECMPTEKNYFDDIWKECLNENKKRFVRSKLKEILKKMEVLGYVKKFGRKNDVFYEKNYHRTFEDHIGFINNLMFTYESKINAALRNIESRKIFLDVSKDLNSYKFSKYTKTDYESLLEAMSGMLELASSITLTKEESHDEKLKNELKKCFSQNTSAKRFQRKGSKGRILESIGRDNQRRANSVLMSGKSRRTKGKN
jgi:hypothetical protein